MNNTYVPGSSDSEDEIFFGAVGSPERRKARLLRNRKTEIFKSPLFVEHQSYSMAPRDDVSKTYSKVPHVKRATETERAHAIKQRPPPLPPFTQLYCSKEEQSLNSPFHLLTKTKNQSKNQCTYRSTRSTLPLPSPHMHSQPLTSHHLLRVPSQQQHRKSGLSPGLSPSFYYDTFDKMCQYNGQASRGENIFPNVFAANRCKSSCSSIEDVTSPAGLLFCSPLLPLTWHKVSKKGKKQKDKKQPKRKTIISESSNSPEANELNSSMELENNKRSQEIYDNSPSNEYISHVQNNMDEINKTPDLFYTSSWITRRHDYKQIHLASDLVNSSTMDSSKVKSRLYRSCSVPEVHVVHPEESDNSFLSIMTPSSTSNYSVSSRIDNLSHELDYNNTENVKTSPKWLLTMASVLNHSLSFSDSDLENYGQSPLLSDLGKTFDTVSTLTPIFSKHKSYNEKPLSTTLRSIINNI